MSHIDTNYNMYDDMCDDTDSNSSQLFFKYEPEQTAIYVAPATTDNFGFILPILANRPLTGNTYTFIYHKKPGCEMFIAPISQRQQFSKAFMSYEKYNEKHTSRRINHIRKVRSEQNIASGYHSNTLKKTHSLGTMSKLMQIFDMSPTPKWPIPSIDFKPPEPLENYFFGAMPNKLKFVEDFVFDE